MRQATLFLLIDKQNDKILLAMKKRGFGAGKFNGFGGKVEKGEDVTSAALRELHEESSIKVNPQDTKKVAELDFFFPHQPDWNQTVHVFVSHVWNGDPVESDEMAPQWFAMDEIPFDKMWSDDKHWMPKVLAGDNVRGSFTFGRDDGTILDLKIDTF
jgi:8-oxo-dGTP diphosphatase